jgi:hypothetical protein
VKVVFLALSLVPASALAAVKTETIKYDGWTNCIRLSNGTVDLVIVPAVGRILRYGYIGKQNLIWENTALEGKPPVSGQWNNYGGDKMWPAPQSDWGWPPDPSLDGVPWSATLIKNGVQLISPVSKTTKLQFTRQIVMASAGTEVDIHNRMDNKGAAHAYAPWQITQINNPKQVYLPFEPTKTLPKGWWAFGSTIDPHYHTVGKNGLTLKLADKISYKFGAFSRTGEIQGTVGSWILHDSQTVSTTATYCDTGSPLEVYLNAGTDRYAEMELLGPLKTMKTGDFVFLDVKWWITPATGVSRTP